MGNLALWPAESDSEPDDNDLKNSGRSGTSESHLERGCSDLMEDDEDSEAAAPM